MMKQILLIEKYLPNVYLIRVDGVNALAPQLFLETNKKLLVNKDYFMKLKLNNTTTHLEGYCFHCRGNLLTSKKETFVFCSHCNKETGVWPSKDSIERQRNAIIKLEKDYAKPIRFGNIKTKSKVNILTLLMK